MDNRTKAANLARAFNNAATIVAQSPGLEEADAKTVAGAVAELASALYQEQNALFEGEKIETPAPAKSSGGSKGWSGGGGSGGDGPTDKQVGFASKLIAEIQEAGGTPDLDIADFKGLSKKDASEAITRLIEQEKAVKGTDEAPF